MSENPETTETLQIKYALQAQRTEFELKNLNEKYSEQVDLFKEHVEEDKQQNATHIEILTRVSDQVDNTKKCLDGLNTKLELSHQKLQSEIEKINKLDEQQNKILDEHIAGVNTLREILATQREEVRLMHQEASLRLDELEKPGVWLNTTKKIVLTAGAIAGSITLVLKLLGVI